ncbi:hypothetical protein N7520_003754 [Penicillium odoratum]|uniref:uncharacterized protein n=1 Tax=Penicillium odoratum TaxID=1167516 RepID=UPI00254741BF|nr:uncharacterized protein N7520_003754 [Penicillium odoratum]KAJ5769195.1 hypothetical protein N7520_003754 [Penicillium odoratum]
MARIQTPVFLQECKNYLDYLVRGQNGDLALPEYERASQSVSMTKRQAIQNRLLIALQNDRGEVAVHRGEVFCRFPSCAHRRNPLSSTRNLRAHLKRHELAIQQTPSGSTTQQEKDKAMKWFADIIATSDQAAAIATRGE